MKSKRDNIQYSYLHTKQRMEERYGYKDLTLSEYKEMCKCCINGIKINAEFTTKGYQYTYLITFKSIKIVAVYHSWRKLISTVLPIQKFKDRYLSH